MNVTPFRISGRTGTKVAASCSPTFSHSGYHIIRPAENGGGTHCFHQGLAFEALPADRQEHWSRLSSVNSASVVVHPLVHEHPLSGQECI